MVFWDTTYPIEHICEKKSLLQIFAKIDFNFPYYYNKHWTRSRTTGHASDRWPHHRDLRAAAAAPRHHEHHHLDMTTIMNMDDN